MRPTYLAILLLGLTVAPVAAQTTLTLSPQLPAPTQTGDLVGVSLQNTQASPVPARIVTFGQAFVTGAVLPTSLLALRSTTGALNPVQMDPIALNADGSVRFAALTTPQPALAANATASGMLTLASAGGSTVPVDLAALAPQLTVSLTVHSGPGGAFVQKFNISRMLINTLAAGGPYWLHGPLASQVRVNRPVTSSLRLTADITGYADGSVTADVQFNNDIAMQPTGGAFVYDATVTLNGVTRSFSNITQYQYQDWHTVLSSNGPSPLNVQHDPAYLLSAGAVLPYDYKSGVDSTLLQSYAALAATPGFGAPLAANGILMGMPTTGGRADIGYTTQWNAVWLMTQNATAATVAMAQGDTGGAVPWNYMLPNGHWLSPLDYTKIWVDPRSGNNGDIAVTQLADLVDSGWSPDPPHAPNLAYVPFLMTATRWYLDRLYAQASFDLSQDWNGAKCQDTTCDIVVNGVDPQRQQAWSIREIQEAAWIGKTGTVQNEYMRRVASRNWKWLLAQTTTRTQQQGQAAGWLPGAIGLGNLAPWGQDYFTGIVVLATMMGDPNAAAYLDWSRNWVVGRFTNPAFNPHDGCAYDLVIGNTTTGQLFQTWNQIEAATVSAGQSNLSGWGQSNGDYCPLARSSLAGFLTIHPNDAAAWQAFNWLSTVGAPYTNLSSFQADPAFGIVPMVQ